MKIKMISMTLAALFGFAGATSAFAQNVNSDTNEWTQALISHSTSPSKHKGYAGYDSATTAIGQDLGSYGKTVGVSGSRAIALLSKISGTHQGYSGVNSASTGIGQDLGSYGKTVGMDGSRV